MVSPEAQDDGLNIDDLELKPDGIANVVQDALDRQVRILRTLRRMRTETMPKYNYSKASMEELRDINGATFGILDQIVETPEGFEDWKTYIEVDASNRFAVEQPKQ